MRFFIIIFFIFIHFPLFADALSGQRSGLSIKGGLWGIGGSFKSQYEELNFTDDALAGFGFGQLNLNWEEQKKYYLLNPLSIEYYLPIGMGSALFGFEARGLPILNSLTGFKPAYTYNSISPGTLGIHNSEVVFRNYDFNLGYQIPTMGGQLLVTPKLVIRDFTQEMTSSATYIGSGFVGVENRSYKAPGYASFLGLNLQFNLFEEGAIFLDLAVNSPIQFPLPQIGLLFDNDLSYSKQYFSTGGSALVLNGKGTQVITGSRTLLGYQHTFGNIFIQIGYHYEQLKSRYESHFELPLSISSSGNGSFSFNELLSNKLIAYDNNNTTEIKSLYLTVGMNFE
ncbi:MAG: hypothetical protein H7A24_14635 [Leptospiraceae bacterium]|nr:hypothetical protein [Leptospiraceae bacterium]MCP5513120.1 hypothetical protein [Leptospiraceae bacterium]